jgi:hypothetical protein
MTINPSTYKFLDKPSYWATVCPTATLQYFHLLTQLSARDRRSMGRDPLARRPPLDNQIQVFKYALPSPTSFERISPSWRFLQARKDGEDDSKAWEYVNGSVGYNRYEAPALSSQVSPTFWQLLLV